MRVDASGALVMGWEVRLRPPGDGAGAGPLWSLDVHLCDRARTVSVQAISAEEAWRRALEQLGDIYGWSKSALDAAKNEDARRREP